MRKEERDERADPCRASCLNSYCSRSGLSLLESTLAVGAVSPTAPGSLDVHWNGGSPDCTNATYVPLEMHAYNPRTFLLRESLCSTSEAPLLYLLIGSTKALLIDTGDVSDPTKMPLARTVTELLPDNDSGKLPLFVVHTHRHLDHRSGDPQFSHLPNTQIVGVDLDSVRRFYGFNTWPNGIAHIDLGDRIIDVIPTPGHNETEISFYDRNTGLFFSGDFLMPGRLLLDDTQADLASAERIAAFVSEHPVSHVLGGHIEENDKGQLYSWQSSFHPHEHALQLNESDLLALPSAIRKFNGFYTQTGTFVLMNSIHLLVAGAAAIIALLMIFVLALMRYFKRKRRRRRPPASSVLEVSLP